MTKDELVKVAKEKFNVSLNPKDKLVDLESQLSSLEKSDPVDKPVEKAKSKTPLYSVGEHGKIVSYNPIHRAEYWNFIYDEKSLTDEQKKLLGK
tara:strand:- start:5200 stop:5481 length:282 start_codon:yes stop_codon:yes gene_type:complete